MRPLPNIKQIGERSFLLEFEQEIGEKTLQKVLAAQQHLQKNLLKEEVEVASSYNSLLITYMLPIEDSYGKILQLKEEISKANIHYNFNSRLFHIPVCYEDRFAQDLREISEAKNISQQEIIELHTGVNYLVYFTGFLPGFLYLGGLPEELYFPRRETPRIEVPKGAVGIGEKQTGIYPQKSPGGWNILGNSPVPLFDPFSDPPCEILAGDRIRFYEVSLEEHREISTMVEKGEFVFRKEEHDG